MQGPARLVPLEHKRKAAELRCGQEPLPALAPVSPDVDAGVGAFASIAVDLGLAQDDREDGGGAVRSARRGVQGGEPALHVGSGDVCNAPPSEPRQNLVPEVSPIDLQGSRLPVPAVVPEDLLGHGLEDRLLRRNTSIAVAVNRTEKSRRAAPGLIKSDGVGVADDSPDTPPVLLAVDEEALPARRQDADTESLEGAVAEIAD